MILCVDSRKLHNAPYVQKDVKLEDIMLNHTKYYENAAEAEKDFYVPLNFAVSVRTVKTNLVLQTDYKVENGKDYYLYYSTITKVDEFVHKGYDLIMYLSAIAFMPFVDYSYAYDEMMLKYSTFQPIGLYNPDSGFTDPIVYSHIIIADEAIDTLKTLLKPGVELVPLEIMRQRKALNLSALLDTLIDVKED